MQAHVAAGDEVQLGRIEVGEQLAHVGGREQVQVRGVPLGFAPECEPQPVLEAERVRDRADERPAGTQQAAGFGDERSRIAQSCTVRANGPGWSSDDANATTPQREQRP